jgi:hypothetical protein
MSLADALGDLEPFPISAGVLRPEAPGLGTDFLSSYCLIFSGLATGLTLLPKRAIPALKANDSGEIASHLKVSTF